MTKLWHIILSVFIAIVVIGGSFIGGIYFDRNYSVTNKNKSTNNSMTVNSINKEKTDTTSDDKDSQKAITSASRSTNSWKTFTNTKYNYSIQYPADATLQNNSENATIKSGPITESDCVGIGTKYVFVKIAAPLDSANPTSCLRTGFGTEYTNAPAEMIIINGTSYTASGMFTSAASAGYYNDDYMLTFGDNNRSEYGISVNEKYDAANMTKTQAKDLVHRILQSYTAVK